jgi:hypothetical protein
MAVLRKVWVTTFGWVITLLGIAALVLPGPGLLLLLAGLVILSQEYAWAERRVEPIKIKAFRAARTGVRTWPRIIASGISTVVMMGVGVWIWSDPTIPEFWILGPRLPFGGWTTGLSVVISAWIALALLVFSVRRFRSTEPADVDDDELTTR